MLIEWDKLPKRMQNDAVKKYYDILYMCALSADTGMAEIRY